MSLQPVQRHHEGWQDQVCSSPVDVRGALRSGCPPNRHSFCGARSLPASRRLRAAVLPLAQQHQPLGRSYWLLRVKLGRRRPGSLKILLTIVIFCWQFVVKICEIFIIYHFYFYRWQSLTNKNRRCSFWWITTREQNFAVSTLFSTVNQHHQSRTLQEGWSL